MTRRLGALLLVASTSGFVLAGCASAVSLEAASAGHIGCKPREITIADDDLGWGTRTWTAACRGREYSCSAAAVGEGGVVACSPMAKAPAKRSVAPSPATASATASGGSKVESAFDDSRQLHVVRGTFGLSTGVELLLVGVPQTELDTIAVAVAGSSWKPSLRECKQLELSVNEQRASVGETRAETKPDRTFSIEGRYTFDTFKPLAGAYATVGVRVCASAWKLTNNQIADLKKFLALFSQLAIQVQSHELPATGTVPVESPAPPASKPAVGPDGA